MPTLHDFFKRRIAEYPGQVCEELLGWCDPTRHSELGEGNYRRLTPSYLDYVYGKVAVSDPLTSERPSGIEFWFDGYRVTYVNGQRGGYLLLERHNSPPLSGYAPVLEFRRRGSDARPWEQTQGFVPAPANRNAVW